MRIVELIPQALCRLQSVVIPIPQALCRLTRRWLPYMIIITLNNYVLVL